FCFFFFFVHPATPSISTLSLHDALPIFTGLGVAGEEVLVHGLEDHVLGPDVKVRKPALVAEGRHRDREGARRCLGTAGSLGLTQCLSRTPEGQDHDHRHNPGPRSHSLPPSPRQDGIVGSGTCYGKKGPAIVPHSRPYSAQCASTRSRSSFGGTERAGNLCLRVASTPTLDESTVLRSSWFTSSSATDGSSATPAVPRLT